MKTATLRMAVAALAALASWQALAQAPQTLRLRGTVEKLDGGMLSVKSSDGEAMRIKLTEDARSSAW